MNLPNGTERQAWDIASDPAAPENKWMAAITVLDGKNPLAKTDLRPPGWIAMPWSIVVSGASASGAVLLFSLMQLILCTKISEVTGDAFLASNLAVAFGAWFVPCLVFSILFTYRRLLFNGGKTWVFAQWALLAGYLGFISFWAIDGQPVQPWDGGLLVLWNIACLCLGLIGTKLAEHSFKSLNQTIGAEKVIVPMTRCFAVIPVVVSAIMLTGMATGFYLPFTQVFFLLTGLVACSSYLVVKQLNAYRTITAQSIATFLWGPFIISNLLLFPAIAVTNVWLSFTGPYFITWVDYAGAFAALGLSIATPIVSGTIASKQLQARAAIGLETGEERRFVTTDSDTSIPALATSPAQEG